MRKEIAGSAMGEGAAAYDVDSLNVRGILGNPPLQNRLWRYRVYCVQIRDAKIKFHTVPEPIVLMGIVNVIDI